MSDSRDSENKKARKLNENLGLYLFILFFAFIFFGAIIFETLSK